MALGAANAHAAVFLDKDGTLVEDVPFNVDPRMLRLTTGAETALARLARAGYVLVVVSNQSGVARGLFAEKELVPVYEKMVQLLERQSVPLAGFYYCPHHPEGSVQAYAIDCWCRKPKSGMILQAARDLRIDLRRSWLVGDILDDVEAGRRAGCSTVLLDNGHETEWVRSPLREPQGVAADLEAAASFILAFRARAGEEDAPRCREALAP